MLRRVALVRSDGLEERIAFIIRVTRIGELGTSLAVTSNGSMLRRNTTTTTANTSTTTSTTTTTTTTKYYSISSQRASAASYYSSCTYIADSCHPDEGSDTLLRNVGSYKSHTT
jgi:hypothetical protein